jgi:hypothetical protein
MKPALVCFLVSQLLCVNGVGDSVDLKPRLSLRSFAIDQSNNLRVLFKYEENSLSHTSAVYPVVMTFGHSGETLGVATFDRLKQRRMIPNDIALFADSSFVVVGTAEEPKHEDQIFVMRDSGQVSLLDFVSCSPASRYVTSRYVEAVDPDDTWGRGGIVLATLTDGCSAQGRGFSSELTLIGFDRDLVKKKTTTLSVSGVFEPYSENDSFSLNSIVPLGAHGYMLAGSVSRFENKGEHSRWSANVGTLELVWSETKLVPLLRTVLPVEGTVLQDLSIVLPQDRALVTARNLPEGGVQLSKTPMSGKGNASEGDKLSMFLMGERNRAFKSAPDGSLVVTGRDSRSGKVFVATWVNSKLELIREVRIPGIAVDDTYECFSSVLPPKLRPKNRR